MKKHLFILLVICGALNAQPPGKFLTKFGGNGEDICYSVKQTLDGGYIVAGSSSSFKTTDNDVYLVKLDSMGNITWERSIGGNGNDIGKSVAQLPDSGYVVAGISSSFNGGYDCFLFRTDKKGMVLWQTNYDGGDWDFGNDVCITSDFGIAVVGYSEAGLVNKHDAFILKYDTSGAKLWELKLNGTGNDDLRSVIQTLDGNIACIGLTESYGEINGDILFMKLDVDGNTLMTRLIGGNGRDYGNDLVEKPNGDLIFGCGKTFGSDQFTKSYLYSIDKNGNSIWENSFYSSNGDESIISVCNSVQSSSITAYLRNVPVPSNGMQGNLYLGSPGGWPYRINSFGGYQDETFYSVEPTSDGGYISGGVTLSYGSSSGDVILVKQDTSFFTYPTIIGIKNNPQQLQSAKVYNTRASMFRITVPEGTCPAKFQLSGIDGRRIAEIKLENTEAEIDLSPYPAGAYLYSIRSSGGASYTGKLLNR